MRPASQLALKTPGLAKTTPLPEYLAELRRSQSVSGYHYIAAREPKYADFPANLKSSIRAVLDARGITRLYSHQCEAFELACAGKNVVVVTPTASGKTLCYN